MSDDDEKENSRMSIDSTPHEGKNHVDIVTTYSTNIGDGEARTYVEHLRVDEDGEIYSEDSGCYEKNQPVDEDDD